MTVSILLWSLLGLFALLLSLVLVAFLRTVFLPRKTSDYLAPPADARAEAYAKTLSRMVRYETVSVAEQNDAEKFRGFHQLLCELFPSVHANLEKIEIDGNLLFHWKGRASAKPLVLMSHQDVVPAEGEWIYPPFSGKIADGKVWGRGSADTKCSLFALLQATEELLAEGFVPQQDIYLSSSCTEEWAGDGCPKLVAELERRKVKPYLVCDEGGGIISEPIGGIRGNYAMVGVFEKGKADVLFRAVSGGGHASAPAAGSPIARLAAFVNETETRNPFRKKMPQEAAAMFASLAPFASSFPLRLLFGNLWLFRPLLVAVLPRISAQAGAMLQTTIAFTMQSGSDAFNVLPQKATLGANLRFIPHQGMEKSLAILQKKAKKHGLTMEIQHANDFTQPVDIHGAAYAFVQETIEKTFPGIAGSPYIMTGATDAQYYQRICDNCMRFAPVIYGPEQMKGMHGLNENIEYNCLPGAVSFYRNLIRDHR